MIPLKAGVGGRGVVFDLAGGEGGKFGEDSAQVLEWIETVGAAGFDEGVEDGAALASLGFADEEPVLFADYHTPTITFERCQT